MRHHATCRVVSLSHPESFTQIAKQSWATYKLAEGLYGNSGNRKSEVADMTDEASDWISVDASVALVETTLQCHRRKAVDLVRLAVNNLKVKSKTVNSTPEWVVLEVAGKEEFYSDRGERIEVCRKDVVGFCLELQHTATRSSPRKRQSALWNNVTLAIADLWSGKEITERPKDRNDNIHKWLISRGIIAKTEDITRTIQRVIKKQRRS
jgi:hypothetical protein